MNLAEFFIKIGVDDDASGKVSNITKSIGSGLATAAKAGAAAVGAAATAIAGLATKSVEAYGNFEQLVGGAETLFKDSQDIIYQNAQEAYKSVGLSANQYMETVTSFSAALISGLEGDTEEAARYADIAVTDMADNANKMGTSMEMIQNAYAGFAKGNYTMLDNLKLGFGGTASEMIRLLNASGLWEQEITSLDGVSLDNIIAAIHEVQTQMGITGTTAKEASSTIQGSLGALKSAWENVLTSMGGGTDEFTLDFDTQLDNLIDSAETFYDNVEPVILHAIDSIGGGLERAIPVIAEKLPTLAAALLPAAIDAVTGLIEGASGIIPTMIQMITENAPNLIPAAYDMILSFFESISDPNNLTSAVDAAFSILTAIGDGIINAVPMLVQRVPAIIINLAAAIVQGGELFLASGATLITKFYEGVFGKLRDMDIGEVLDSVKETFDEVVSNAEEWGKDMISNFINGIGKSAQNLWNSMGEVAKGIWSYIHFSEPEKGALADFHTYAPDMMETFAKGIRDNEHLITDQVKKSFDFGETLTSSVEPYSAPSASSRTAEEEPFTIIVQSVLDGTVIGETAYRYARQKERAYGL